MQRQVKIFILTITFQLLCIYSTCAQSDKNRIRHLTTDEGLPTNLTSSVIKDSRGFIWITTRSGLCRYDGINIKVFQNDPADSTSLSDDLIDWPKNIVEDSSGNLWIGTSNGLNRYDPITGTFKRYLHDPNDHNSLSHNSIICLCLDHKGTLWIGAGYGRGLNKYNPEIDNFSVYGVYLQDELC